jgi:hypothetical protein
LLFFLARWQCCPIWKKLKLTGKWHTSKFCFNLTYWTSKFCFNLTSWLPFWQITFNTQSFGFPLIDCFNSTYFTLPVAK